MKYPNLLEEKKLWKKGFKSVIGLDEAGRGPLAGPVVAGAVSILDTEYQIPAFTKVSAGRQNIKIRDSKQLTFTQREKIYKIIIKDPRLQWGIGIVSEKIIDRINILEATKLAMIKAIKNLQQRERFYEIITKHPAFKWGIGIVSEKIIDRINILEATKLAMIKAVKNLQQRKSQSKITKSILSQKPTIVGKEDKIDFLILDGNFILPTKALAKIRINKSISQKSIIRGDEKVFSCSAASIVAKVTRDRIMARLHEKYPKYRFDLHKGYGTKLHLKMLKKYGSCKIHRKTFKPKGSDN